jgi:hypothetical protein
MEGEKEERRSRFAEILRKLHSKIVQEKEESFASKANFIPVRVPVEVFRRNRQQLIELYDISDGPAQHRASQSVDGRRFADKVTGTAIKPAARILAIILSVYHDRPFQLDSNFWQTFSKRCVDPQHSGVLDDGRLPFSLPTARELIIDAEYGELFFSRQHMYCAPIIQEGASQSLDHQAPLPYLEETLIGSGHYGTVYAVKVERSHFRFTTDHSPKVTYLLDENVTLARKDIKLRSQKSPEDTKEWNIFQGTNMMNTSRAFWHALSSETRSVCSCGRRTAIWRDSWRNTEDQTMAEHKNLLEQLERRPGHFSTCMTRYDATIWTSSLRIFWLSSAKARW